jgi:alpha-tubulin suppressor-like RCC1 family protein
MSCGSILSMASSPIRVEMEERIVRVCAGESHFVCLSDRGNMYTWGVGEYGQCVRPPGRATTPQRVPLPHAVTSIYACGFHTFYCSSQWYGCGKNGYGELGLGHTRVVYTPVPVPIQGIVQIVGGLHHCLFRTCQGHVYATGRNSDGQLGVDRTLQGTTTPIRVEVPPIQWIASGVSSHHSCT